MRKYSIIIITSIVTSLLTIACNKDENPEAEQSLIVGDWSVSQFEADILINGSELANFLVNTFNLSSQEVAIAELLIRNEIEDQVEGQLIQFRNDDTYAFTFDGESQIGTYRYLKEENQLILMPDNETEFAFEIKELGDNLLELYLLENLAMEDFLALDNFEVPEETMLTIEGNITFLKN